MQKITGSLEVCCNTTLPGLLLYLLLPIIQSQLEKDNNGRGQWTTGRLLKSQEEMLAMCISLLYTVIQC